MTFWAVVFIVLMILWLVLGCWHCNRDLPGIGGTILPWACVAILGGIVLGGLR